jgi:hypothetical protein
MTQITPIAEQPNVSKANTTTEEKPQEKKPVHWEKFRGWTTKFLGDLQYSGGKTTREISDATGCKINVAAVILQRLKRYNVIERVAGWGWRITSDGIGILLWKNNKNNNNYINTSLINNIQTNNSNGTEKQEKPLSCFNSSICHIRRILKETVYNAKTMFECDGCVQKNENEYPKNFIGRSEVKISI